MSVENPVIAASDLSREIVRNLLATGLQDYADDTSTGLTDPRAGERGGGDAPFVLTSWPTETTALYPHIVVSEEDVALSPIDRRHDLWGGEFTAGFQIEATSDTEKFALKDGVRAFVITKYADDTLQNAGFADVSIESTEPTDWDDNSETAGLLVTISGLVHTA